MTSPPRVGESNAAYMRRQDSDIRQAMLMACHFKGLCSTQDLVDCVEGQTGFVLNTRQVANMAARLHKAGWLDYSYGGKSRHYLTDAGRDVVSLLFGATR